VSRAGCADAVASEHRLDTLAAASVLHAGRPAVVTVGVGATAVTPGDGAPVVARARRPAAEADASPAGAAPLAA
jgi:uroporphyrin-III C-methyltransferase